MAELPENPSYTKAIHLAWLQDQLQAVEEKIRELAIQYSLLYRALGNLRQHCGALGQEGKCGDDDRCYTVRIGYTDYCEPTHAEENAVYGLEDQLLAAGINPQDLIF